jgi:PAS domain S-box-containing protein
MEPDDATQAERDRLFELSLDLLCTAGLDGYFRRVNPAFERVLGYSTEELTSRPFVDFVHPDDREATLAEVEKLADGLVTIDFENRYRCSDGSYKWLGWRAMPVPEEGLIFAVARDVSAQKEIEQERLRLFAVLEAQNERLRNLDRLKNDMLASVSHELRTPVTSIRGFLALVLADKAGPLKASQRQFLEVANRSTERLLRLVEDLLMLTQAEAGRLDLRMGEADLDQVLRDTIEAARLGALAQSVSLSLRSEPLPVIPGDAARLAQLTDNLVGNAIKFTPPGGRVVVRAEVLDGDVELVVSDSGIGISEADQARIFDAFYRAVDVGERPIPGTGLGLAISKAIVDGHGGTIAVESREGEGSSFRVRLPVMAEKPAALPVA